MLSVTAEQIPSLKRTRKALAYTAHQLTPRRSLLPPPPQQLLLLPPIHR
jgi:hypothetical protein